MSVDPRQFIDLDIEKVRPQATPFALLALEPAYKIDKEVLERHYLILQRELHPDRFVNRPGEAHTAQMMSAWINRAYTALKDPLLRAQALLRLKGCPSPDENVCDPLLLAEVMEWREQLENFKTASEKSQFCHELQQRIQSCENNFEHAWQAQDPGNLQQKYLELSYLIQTLRHAQGSDFSESVAVA